MFGKTWENTPLEYRVVAANLGNESVTSAGASDARPRTASLRDCAPLTDGETTRAQFMRCLPRRTTRIESRNRPNLTTWSFAGHASRLPSSCAARSSVARPKGDGHGGATMRSPASSTQTAAVHPAASFLKRSRMRTRCLQSIALIIHFIDTEQSQRPSPAPTTEVNLNHQTLKSISIYALASTEPQTIAQ